MGYACLEEVLLSDIKVCSLFTHEDDPKEEIWFKRPKEIAERMGIPIYTPSDLKDKRWVDVIKGLSPDVIFSFYYRHMIPKEIIDIPKVGAFNLHGSLLPRFRGRAPINWVIIEGEQVTGVTLHYMVERPDAGDIIAQREIEITFEDTAYTLSLKMADAARLLMKEILPKIKRGRFERHPQIGPSSYYGARRPEDGLISWNKDAISIYNLIRAVTHPYPGAFTYLDGKKLFIWQAYPEAEEKKGVPGRVISLRPFRVSAAKGILRLRMVQLEGEEEMDGDLFALTHSVENKCLGGDS
jgi:methionyl-tRNA formyltransferase